MIAPARRLVVLSHGLLLIQAAKDYGRIDGGPDIVVEDCERWVAVGAEHGLEVSQAEIVATAKALFAEMAAPS